MEGERPVAALSLCSSDLLVMLLIPHAHGLGQALYIGTAFAAVGFGGFWPLAVVIVAEIWGKKHVGVRTTGTGS